MKTTIKYIEIVCATLIVAGGINVFFPLSVGVFDSEIIANISSAALFAYAVLLFTRKRNLFGFKSLTVFVVGVLLLFSPMDANAQATNYSEQVEAIKQGFSQKSIQPVEQYISMELKFLNYPAGVSRRILSQVFSNLPKLKAILITGSREGEADVRYEFTALGVRNSKIHFNEAGKITKIELIDNLLEEQARAQAALARQVQEPSPGELGMKYKARKIEFAAKDGLAITADLYEVDPSAPVILLCHSGGANKYEYADIAPKLNARGYNALAIDQRSGGPFAGRANETFNRAKNEGLPTGFADAQPDIEAAIDYLAGKYNTKVTLWGSSYSAALSLYVAPENTKLNGLILFSPGDYLAGEKGTLRGRLVSLDIPFLVTSTREEAESIADVLLDGIEPVSGQIHHIPSFEGYHGSRALWEGQQGSEEYWEQVWATLAVIYPGE